MDTFNFTEIDRLYFSLKRSKFFEIDAEIHDCHSENKIKLVNAYNKLSEVIDEMIIREDPNSDYQLQRVLLNDAEMFKNSIDSLINKSTLKESDEIILIEIRDALNRIRTIIQNGDKDGYCVIHE